MDDELDILTATVTPPIVAPLLQATGIQTATKTALPDGWSLNKVASLVRDVAQAMYDLPNILRKHNLTQPQYDVLANNEFFKRALEQFTLDWNSAANTQKRLSLEAAIALEDALPTVAARASKPMEPLADVVQLVKVLAEIAGSIGNKAVQTQGPSERFKIEINIGAEKFQREATPMIVVNPELENAAKG